MRLVEKSQDIVLGKIRKSAHFFRDHPAEESLVALMESIRQKGQIHPVSVIRLPEATVRGHEYELINGHRRFLAMERASLPTIRADVYEHSPEETQDEGERQSAIVRFLHDANMQEPLTPIELAEQFMSMMEAFDLSTEDIARMFHRSVENVEDTLKFHFIDKGVREKIAEPDNASKVTGEHLRILADYAAPTKRGWRLDATQQMAVVDKILTGEDKRLQESPLQFAKEIRNLKSQARQEKKEQREQSDQQPNLALKALFKQVDKIERAVVDLGTLAIPGEIGFLDRKALIQRCLNAAKALAEFSDGVPAEVELSATAAASNG